MRSKNLVSFKNLKTLSLLVLFLCGLASTVAAHAQQAKQHKVVFAMTSGDELDWQLGLGNLGNLLKAMPDAEVEVVAFGPGINMVVKTSKVSEEIQAMMAKGVKFVACENSMRGHNLKIEDLIPGMGSVPSGIVEVVSKQEQGWAYIKAGR